MDRDISIPQRTRASLIARMKDWRDQASWQVFFDSYWRLIYDTARKAGLSDSEAQDVLQETMLCVSRKMPDFDYDAGRGSFKAWLLKTTRWRTVDRVRQRLPVANLDKTENASETSVAAINNIPDPASLVPDDRWETDWKKNLLAVALARLRIQIDPQKYQLFDFYVNKDWPAGKVAERFGVPVRQVYLAKHRITVLLKAEVRRLQRRHSRAPGKARTRSAV